MAIGPADLGKWPMAIAGWNLAIGLHGYKIRIVGLKLLSIDAWGSFEIIINEKMWI